MSREAQGKEKHVDEDQAAIKDHNKDISRVHIKESLDFKLEGENQHVAEPTQLASTPDIQSERAVKPVQANIDSSTAPGNNVSSSNTNSRTKGSLPPSDSSITVLICDILIHVMRPVCFYHRKTKILRAMR